MASPENSQRRVFRACLRSLTRPQEQPTKILERVWGRPGSPKSQGAPRESKNSDLRQGSNSSWGLLSLTSDQFQANEAGRCCRGVSRPRPNVSETRFLSCPPPRGFSVPSSLPRILPFGGSLPQSPGISGYPLLRWTKEERNQRVNSEGRPTAFPLLGKHFGEAFGLQN